MNKYLLTVLILTCSNLISNEGTISYLYFDQNFNVSRRLRSKALKKSNTFSALEKMTIKTRYLFIPLDELEELGVFFYLSKYANVEDQKYLIDKDNIIIPIEEHNLSKLPKNLRPFISENQGSKHKVLSRSTFLSIANGSTAAGSFFIKHKPLPWSPDSAKRAIFFHDYIRLNEGILPVEFQDSMLAEFAYLKFGVFSYLIRSARPILKSNPNHQVYPMHGLLGKKTKVSTDYTADNRLLWWQAWNKISLELLMKSIKTVLRSNYQAYPKDIDENNLEKTRSSEKAKFLTLNEIISGSEFSSLQNWKKKELLPKLARFVAAYQYFLGLSLVGHTQNLLLEVNLQTGEIIKFYFRDTEDILLDPEIAAMRDLKIPRSDEFNPKIIPTARTYYHSAESKLTKSKLSHPKNKHYIDIRLWPSRFRWQLAKKAVTNQPYYHLAIYTGQAIDSHQGKIQKRAQHSRLFVKAYASALKDFSKQKILFSEKSKKILNALRNNPESIGRFVTHPDFQQRAPLRNAVAALIADIHNQVFEIEWQAFLDKIQSTNTSTYKRQALRFLSFSKNTTRDFNLKGIERSFVFQTIRQYSIKLWRYLNLANLADKSQVKVVGDQVLHFNKNGDVRGSYLRLKIRAAGLCSKLLNK